MSRPFIFFITGTSASGKTTLYESLRKDSDLKDIEFHDIDEGGVPPVARTPWRKYRVELLLFEAAQKQTAGTSSIICGIALPHEITESKYYNPEQNVHFLLVEASEPQIRERLQARSQANAARDRFDESFNLNNVDRTIKDNFDLRKVLSNSVASLKNGQKIDASNLDEQRLCEKAKSLIRKLGE